MKLSFINESIFKPYKSNNLKLNKCAKQLKAKQKTKATTTSYLNVKRHE